MKRLYLQVILLALLLVLGLAAEAAAGHGPQRGLSLQLGCQLRDTAWVQRVSCPRFSDTPETGITFVTPGSTDFFRYWSDFASGGGPGAASPSGGVVLLHLRRGGKPGVHVPSLKDFLIELGDF